MAPVACGDPWQENRAVTHGYTDATARQVAVLADTLRVSDLRTATLLSIAAWRIGPLPETRRALLASFARPDQNAFTDPPRAVTQLCARVGTTLTVAERHTCIPGV